MNTLKECSDDKKITSKERMNKCILKRINPEITKLEDARRRKQSADNKIGNITNQLSSIASVQEIWTNFKRSSLQNSFSNDTEPCKKESYGVLF